jgi:hypothetical protein
MYFRKWFLSPVTRMVSKAVSRAGILAVWLAVWQAWQGVRLDILKVVSKALGQAILQGYFYKQF